MGKIDKAAKAATPDAPATAGAAAVKETASSSGFKLSLLVPVFAILAVVALNSGLLSGLLAGKPEPSECGNGILEGMEECDDGNLVDGDGCTKECTVQKFYVCPNNVCYRYGTKGVDRVANISFEDLMEKYWKKGLMVILTDGGVSQWKAMKTWSPQYMKDRWPDLEVEIQFGREANPNFELESMKHKKTTSMSKYVDMILGSDSSNDFYMTANNQLLTRPEIKSIYDDMQPMFPSMINVASNQGSGTYFWFGPKGIITPIHHDPLTLFHTHIVGRKKWIFYPPDMRPNLYNHVGVFSQVDPLKNRTQLNLDFPLFKDIVEFEEILHPGETLFMPVGWWHHVQSLDRCMGVSFTNFKQESRQYEADMYKNYGNNAGGLRYGNDEKKTKKKKGEKMPPLNDHVNEAMKEKVQNLLDTNNNSRDIITHLWKQSSNGFPNYSSATFRAAKDTSGCSAMAAYPDWIAWIYENEELNIKEKDVLGALLDAGHTGSSDMTVPLVKTWVSCYGLDDTKFLKNVAARKKAELEEGL